MLIFFDKTEAGYAYKRYAYKKKHVAIEIVQEFQSNLEEEVNSSII